MKNRYSGQLPGCSLSRRNLIPPTALLTALVAVWPVLAETRYVNATNPSPASPYTSWATAATNIQDAVDVAQAGETVLVTNGTYATGGRAIHGLMTNRVAVDKPLVLCSVNGPQFTIIQGRQVPGTTNGNGAIRCVYLTNGASLSGFTLMKGATRSAGDSLNEQGGGGVFCNVRTVVVSNCLVVGNAGASSGGGGLGGTFYNCTFSGNSVSNSGGGTHSSTLYNCVLSSNAARLYGGGAYGCWLWNCALTRNASDSGGGAVNSTLNNCVLTTNSAATEGGGPAVAPSRTTPAR